MTSMSKALIAVLLVLGSSSSLAGPVTVTSNLIRNLVSEDALGWNIDDFTNASVPQNFTYTTAIGAASNVTQTNWVETATKTTFDYRFTQFVDNTVSNGGAALGYDSAQSYTNMFFTATENARYEIDGFYDVINPVGTRVFSQVALYDLTTNTTLFEDVTESFNTVNASYVVGDVLDGDAQNRNEGALAGSLIAGHSYRFRYNYQIATVTADANRNFIETFGAASATGGARLQLETTDVPTPAPLLVLVAGMIGVLVARKRSVQGVSRAAG